MADEIFEAIQKHDPRRLEALLSSGADANERSKATPHWRPLAAAIEEVYHGGPPEVVLEMIGSLIRHRADVNAWDDERHLTPLLSAIYWENRDAARLLLEAGADPNVVNRNRESPLGMAVEQDDLELTAMLLGHGAEKGINRPGGVSGMTPLAVAASNLNIALIRLLMEAGADPEVHDADSQTARDYLPPRDQADPDVWDSALEMLVLRIG
jgi:ankyrin repeat protein